MKNGAVVMTCNAYSNLHTLYTMLVLGVRGHLPSVRQLWIVKQFAKVVEMRALVETG